MSSSLIYWVLVLDNIRDGADRMLVLCTIGAVFSIALGGFMYIDEKKIHKGVCFLGSAIGLILLLCSLVLVFVPNTKQMATIIILPKIANSEFVQETLPKDSKMLYEMTIDYIKSKVQEEVK